MKNLIQLPAEFDYNLLLHALRDYKKPRDKIRGLIRGKDIIRVKKGLYVLGREYNKPYSKFVLANLIYGPSYIRSNRPDILEHDTGTCRAHYQHDNKEKKAV